MTIPAYKVGPTKKAGVMELSFGPYFKFTGDVKEFVEFAKHVVAATRLTREAEKIALGLESDFGEGTIVQLDENREVSDDDDPFRGR